MKTYRRYKLTMPNGDVTYHRQCPPPCELPQGADLRVSIVKVREYKDIGIPLKHDDTCVAFSVDADEHTLISNEDS